MFVRGFWLAVLRPLLVGVGGLDCESGVSCEPGAILNRANSRILSRSLSAMSSKVAGIDIVAPSAVGGVFLLSLMRGKIVDGGGPRLRSVLS